ncbi:hypothetical protein ABI57_22835 [Salmonella enterica subsp. enterica serovar Veneziana]|nr:hypothetical protein ABI57_22835 [Salmonella enterica subsp. enterica serovar Veneziana]
MKWYAERKFNFEEIANFQEPRPPANIRPQRIEQAGGSRKNFAAPASKKARPRAVFCGGLAPHTVARSARRCAAFDFGGFGSASSRDITPMCHAVRASSPNVMAHAVAHHSGVSEDRRPLVGCILKARITGLIASGDQRPFWFLWGTFMGYSYGVSICTP